MLSTRKRSRQGLALITTLTLSVGFGVVGGAAAYATEEAPESEVILVDETTNPDPIEQEDPPVDEEPPAEGPTVVRAVLGTYGFQGCDDGVVVIQTQETDFSTTEYFAPEAGSFVWTEVHTAKEGYVFVEDPNWVLSEGGTVATVTYDFSEDFADCDNPVEEPEYVAPSSTAVVTVTDCLGTAELTVTSGSEPIAVSFTLLEENGTQELGSFDVNFTEPFGEATSSYGNLTPGIYVFLAKNNPNANKPLDELQLAALAYTFQVEAEGCDEEPTDPIVVKMVLTYIEECAPDQDNTWRVRNPSSVDVPYMVRGSNEVRIAPPGDSFFTTPRGAETMIIDWGGGTSGVATGSQTKAAGKDIPANDPRCVVDPVDPENPGDGETDPENPGGEEPPVDPENPEVEIPTQPIPETGDPDNGNKDDDDNDTGAPVNNAGNDTTKKLAYTGASEGFGFAGIIALLLMMTGIAALVSARRQRA